HPTTECSQHPPCRSFRTRAGENLHPTCYVRQTDDLIIYRTTGRFIDLPFRSTYVRCLSLCWLPVSPGWYCLPRLSNACTGDLRTRFRDRAWLPGSFHQRTGRAAQPRVACPRLRSFLCGSVSDLSLGGVRCPSVFTQLATSSSSQACASSPISCMFPRPISLPSRSSSSA